jgi:hypothetical protein
MFGVITRCEVGVRGVRGEREDGGGIDSRAWQRWALITGVAAAARVHHAARRRGRRVAARGARAAGRADARSLAISAGTSIIERGESLESSHDGRRVGSTTASGCWMGGSSCYRAARRSSFERAHATSFAHRRRHMDLALAVTMNLYALRQGQRSPRGHRGRRHYSSCARYWRLGHRRPASDIGRPPQRLTGCTVAPIPTDYSQRPR